MGRSKISPVLVAGVAVGAVVLYTALGIVVDIHLDGSVATHPFTANLVAALVLFPFEVLVVSGIVRWWFARQDQRRWQAVTAELTEAIDTEWTRLRGLIVHRYGLYELDRRLAAISEADQLWARLEEQQDNQPIEMQGSDAAQWDLPANANGTLATVAGIWYQTFGAGVEVEERALARRLTAVQLPRLNLNEPELTALVRRLIDAIEDLTDVREVLRHWHEPFPTFVPQPIGVKGPTVARDALAQLTRMLLAAHAVAVQGEALAEKLTAPPFEDKPSNDS